MLRLVLITIALCIGAWPAATSAQGQKRVALVIGNNAYTSEARLKNAINDAKLVAGALSKVGFKTVEPRADLGIAEFRQALRRFQAEADGAEVALIYYAGHGMEANGANWLIPTDAALAQERDLDYEAVRIDLALQALSGARMRLLVLDACRNNPFGRSWRPGARSVARGLKPVDTDDVLVLFAAAPGQTASDGTGTNSPFASAFAKLVPEPGLAVQFLVGRVRDDVLGATGGTQRPYVSSCITGVPFYLVPPAAGPAAASTPPVQVPSQQSAAAEAWSHVRESTSIADLEAFKRRFGDTFYGDLAGSRLEELKKTAELQRLAMIEQEKAAAEAKRKSDEAAAAAAKAAEDRKRATDETPVVVLSADTEYWFTIKDTNDRKNFEEYIQRFPNGRFVNLAKRKLEQLVREKADAFQAVVKLPPIDGSSYPRAKSVKPSAVAVIIGNSAYRNGLPAVDFALRDADAMWALVIKSLGIPSENTILLKDAARNQMDEVLGSDKSHKGTLWRTIDSDGNSDIVVYFSGHGAPGSSDSDANFLLPVDGDPNHASLNGYPLSQLYKNLGELKARSITVFLAASFSGLSAGNNKTPLFKRIAIVEGPSKQQPSDASMINVFAAAGDRQLSSWDPEAGHGIFTRHLIAGLSGEADENLNKEITAKELRDYLGRQVKRTARRLHGRDQDIQFSGNPYFVLAKY